MKVENQRKLIIADLGRQPYRPVWDFQHKLQEHRIRQEIPDTLILVEHDPVYTIGKNGSDLHIIASPEFLQQNKIDVIHVDRGGDVTYHGPGQLVGYPIFDLSRHRESVSWYMRALEEVFIRVLQHWGVQGTRNEGYTGVWIGDEKIVALGVRITHWVTLHGFAFNVNPQLDHYSGIIPCGIFQSGVTSLEKLLEKKVEMKEVKEIVIEAFKNVFNFSDVEADAGSFWAEQMLMEDTR